MGAIRDSVKRYVPASYSVLVGSTNSYDYTIDDLQSLADFVQYRLFTTIAGATNEASNYNPIEIELLGSLTTLQFIPAAVDYWGDQLHSQATSGTNEDVTYFDRRPDLWKVYSKLTEVAAELADDLGINLNKVLASFPVVTYGDNGRGVLITTDPQLFPPAYTKGADPLFFDPIPWVSGG